MYVFRGVSPGSFGCFRALTRGTRSSLYDSSPNRSNWLPKRTIMYDGCDFKHCRNGRLCEPFINGQAVPYDPKYHKVWLERNRRNGVLGPQPIGGVVRVTKTGPSETNHYQAYEYEGTHFQLEDPVLVTPEYGREKPYVAIVKDITQNTSGGQVIVTGQWLYRPEDAEKQRGGGWQACDPRELFYSFRHYKVLAECVMHRCVVYYLSWYKQLPDHRLYPGFIVKNVYDPVKKKLIRLTDKNYEDDKRKEIDLLLNETMAILPHLPKYRDILCNFDALTRERRRDTWLEKLLQSVEYACTSTDYMQEEKETVQPNGLNHLKGDKFVIADKAQEKGVKGEYQLIWPDSAVSAVTALEKASNEAFSKDFAKYNQKLMELVSNLKNNGLLAQRLLKKELEPSKILNMSPNELKEGLTAEGVSQQPT